MVQRSISRTDDTFGEVLDSILNQLWGRSDDPMIIDGFQVHANFKGKKSG